MYIASPSSYGTDETLIGCNLMGVLDCMITLHHPSWTMALGHWVGVISLLQCRNSETVQSPVVRSMIHYGGLYTFVVPVLQGVPSPFEADHWLEADPAGPIGPSQVMRLRRCTHQGNILLPRLVCKIRGLRNATVDAEGLAEASAVSHRLLDMEDKAGENWLLHHVKIVPTLDAQDKVVTPLSMQHGDLDEMAWALGYWKVRLVVIRLHIVIHRLQNADGTTSSAGSDIPEIDEERLAELMKEELRLVKNILMSWQQVHENGPYSMTSMTMAFVAMWTSVRHQKQLRKDVSLDTLAAWLLPKFRQTWAGWAIPTTLAGLDRMCDAMEGGPLDPYMPGLLGVEA